MTRHSGRWILLPISRKLKQRQQQDPGQFGISSCCLVSHVYLNSSNNNNSNSNSNSSTRQATRTRSCLMIVVVVVIVTTDIVPYYLLLLWRSRSVEHAPTYCTVVGQVRREKSLSHQPDRHTHKQTSSSNKQQQQHIPPISGHPHPPARPPLPVRTTPARERQYDMRRHD